MGIYLNPSPEKFAESVHSEIYVDKSELIAFTNTQFKTRQKWICVSRPRRFGKSMALDMLAAYYSRGAEAEMLFDGLKIQQNNSFKNYLNKYDVISVNMQRFLSRNEDIHHMIEDLCKNLLWELHNEYNDVSYFDRSDLVRTMQDIYVKTRRPFVVLIDEWDCIFREEKMNVTAQKRYLDFLRDWLKDQEYLGLAYMTGILPIKKYGTHSALNMFTEYSMTNPKRLAEYIGFTEDEVRSLCEKYHMSFEEAKAWYDGYFFRDVLSIYNPKSVVEAMLSGVFDSYWNQTETYEALKIYIQFNFDDLKEKIIKMLAGGRISVDIGSFTNDMANLHSSDDVFTLMVHLGYLAYDFETKEVFIPNKEVSCEYVTSIKAVGWNEVIQAIDDSQKLLEALWNKNSNCVAAGIERVHEETSILQYNDENALSYTINLAFYTAREYYTVIREMPTGSGYADIAYIPRKRYAQKPAMLIELKWDKSAQGAIAQIKSKHYIQALDEYRGNLLLCGINYDRKTKSHSCEIEEILL